MPEAKSNGNRKADEAVTAGLDHCLVSSKHKQVRRQGFENRFETGFVKNIFSKTIQNEAAVSVVTHITGAHIRNAFIQEREKWFEVLP